MIVKTRTAIVLCTLAFLTASESVARIKLITLPVRERVEIQLDHPNTTLVEEERIVPLVKGNNQVDFSWANTQIQPESLVFRVLGPINGKKFVVNVLSVSYPPNENALVWSVYSDNDGAARVRISYVLGNLNKSFVYRAIADRTEQKLTLSHYLRIENFANEDYGSSGIWVGFGNRFKVPIGLAETKKILVAKHSGIPIRKTYTADLSKYGYQNEGKKQLKIPMHYVIKNVKQNGLGKAALPLGKARIFQKDSSGNSTFIGEDWSKFTPVDDESSLYLGVARDVVVKRTIDSSEQKRIAGNLFDHDVVIKYEIENFKDTEVVLDIVEDIRSVRDTLRNNNGRDVEWIMGNKTTLGSKDGEKSTFDKPMFHISLPANKDGKTAKKQFHKLHIVLKNEW